MKYIKELCSLYKKKSSISNCEYIPVINKCICTWKWTFFFLTLQDLRSGVPQPPPNMAMADQNKVKSKYCRTHQNQRGGKNLAQVEILSFLYRTGWLKNKWDIVCCYMVGWRVSPCLLSSLKVIWLNLVQTAFKTAAQRPCNRALCIPNGSPCGTALHIQPRDIKLQAHPDKSHPLHVTLTCHQFLDHKSSCSISYDSDNDSV